MPRDPVQSLIQTGVFTLLYLVAITLLSPPVMWVGGYLVGLTVGGLLASAFANGFALRIFGPRPLLDVGLHWDRASRFNLLAGLGGGAGAATLVLGGALAVHLARWTPAPQVGANWRTILFVPLLLFSGALAEELLFHGFAFQVLVREFGAYAIVFAVGALFGILHSNNPNASILGLVNTAGFGILFGIAWLRTRSLWMPIGLHFGWNLTLPLFGAELSGITINPAGITLLWNVGPLWSGGKYGPEASILTSAVLLVLLLFIVKMPVRPQQAPLLESPPPSSAPPAPTLFPPATE